MNLCKQGVHAMVGGSCANCGYEPKEEIDTLRTRVTELEAEVERLHKDYQEGMAERLIEVEQAEADNAKLREVIWKVKVYITNGAWHETVSPDLFIEQALNEVK